MIHKGEDRLMQSIAHEVDGLVPEFQEELWDRPVSPAEPAAWYLQSSVPNHSREKRAWVLRTAAACLVLCMVSAFLLPLRTSASIYLDVNPSVTLQVNYRNRVVKAAACNEDAEEILSNMDLRGADLDVALYAVLGSMVHHGYLTDVKDTVLVSVHSGNETRAKALKAEVTGIVNQDLDTMICAGEVLSQQIDAESLDRADPHLNATPGKSAFIEKLEEEYPQLRNRNLRDMTMDEIVFLLEQEDLDYSDYLEDPDRDDDEDDDIDDDDDDDDDDPDCDDGLTDDGCSDDASDDDDADDGPSDDAADIDDGADDD